MSIEAPSQIPTENLLVGLVGVSGDKWAVSKREPTRDEQPHDSSFYTFHSFITVLDGFEYEVTKKVNETSKAKLFYVEDFPEQSEDYFIVIRNERGEFDFRDYYQVEDSPPSTTEFELLYRSIEEAVREYGRGVQLMSDAEVLQFWGQELVHGPLAEELIKRLKERGLHPVVFIKDHGKVVVDAEWFE